RPGAGGRGLRGRAVLRAVLRRPVGELEEVADRLGGVHEGNEAREARRGDHADGQPAGDPLADAVRAGEQLADREPQAAPARRLVDLTVAGAALEADKG